MNNTLPLELKMVDMIKVIAYAIGSFLILASTMSGKVITEEPASDEPMMLQPGQYRLSMILSVGSEKKPNEIPATLRISPGKKTDEAQLLNLRLRREFNGKPIFNELVGGVRGQTIKFGITEFENSERLVTLHFVGKITSTTTAKGKMGLFGETEKIAGGTWTLIRLKKQESKLEEAAVGAINKRIRSSLKLTNVDEDDPSKELSDRTRAELKKATLKSLQIPKIVGLRLTHERDHMAIVGEWLADKPAATGFQLRFDNETPILVPFEELMFDRWKDEAKSGVAYYIFETVPLNSVLGKKLKGQLDLEDKKRQKLTAELMNGKQVLSSTDFIEWVQAK